MAAGFKHPGSEDLVSALVADEAGPSQQTR